MLISRDIKFTPCVCLEGLKRIFEKPFFHHLVTRVLHVHTLKKWRAKQLALTKELPTAMSVLLWHVLSRFFSHVVCFENWPRIQSMKKNTILRGCGYLVFWQFERWWLQPSNQRKLKEGSSTEMISSFSAMVSGLRKKSLPPRSLILHLLLHSHLELFVWLCQKYVAT